MLRVYFDDQRRKKCVKRKAIVIPIEEDRAVRYQASSSNALDTMIHDEMSDDLRRSIDLLDEKWKTPLLLMYLQDYSIEAISEQTGIKEATVKTRLHRGRKKLRYLVATP